MKNLISVLGSVVTIFALSPPVSGHFIRTQNKDVITKARGAYYNLAAKGFYGFKAVIVPNWEVILGPTATRDNLKIFRAVHLSMTVEANGAVTVNHEVADADQTRVEPYVKPIRENVQRLLSGFFGTWARFMVNSPFPDNDTESKIENSGTEYRVFYTMQTNDVMLTMTSDLLVTQWKLTSTRAKRTLRPVFQKTAEGLLLSGYQTLFEPIADGIKTTLEFNIEYQDVSGMKLPQNVRINGIHGNEPVAAEFIFNQYVLIHTKDKSQPFGGCGY